MAYQLKYFYEYGIEGGKTGRVEIYQDTELVLVPEEITAGAAPFMSEMPSIDHKVQPVIGRGFDLELFSDSDMKFYHGLEHDSPKEFMVKHFINNEIEFLGYLNSEMYSEPYDEETNYIISVTGNDGFALMDRMNFLQADLSKYKGLKTKWELINIVLERIGLPWENIFVSISTTFDGYSGAVDSTIFHESYILSGNFYDEDGEPMTLRDTLETILSPYGASIRAEDGSVYITDLHTQASIDTITWKRFAAPTFAYVEDVVENNVRDISSIKYAGTGQSIERSGGVNRQVVSYSPYQVKEILRQSITSFDEFETVPANYTEQTAMLMPSWYSKTLDGNAYWEDRGGIVSRFRASYFEDPQQANIYLDVFTGEIGYATWAGRIKNPIEASIRRYGTLFDKISDEGVSIKVEGEIFVKTKSHPYIANEFLQSQKVNKVWPSFRLKIGDNYMNDAAFMTTTDTHFTFPNETVYQDKDIADKWVKFGIEGEGFTYRMRGSGVLSGEVEFEIWNDPRIGAEKDTDHSEATLWQAGITTWYRNISIKLVKQDGTEIDDVDIEFVGELNKDLKDEGTKVSLNAGTMADYTDRAMILKYDTGAFRDIQTWTRAGQSFKIEELLLGTISSNYKKNFITLGSLKFKNNFKLRNVITDTYIPNKKMMVAAASINYRDNIVDCTLVEVSPDDQIIQN